MKSHTPPTELQQALKALGLPPESPIRQVQVVVLGPNPGALAVPVDSILRAYQAFAAIRDAATFETARAVFDEAYKSCTFSKGRDILARAMISREDHPMRVEARNKQQQTKR